jgi:hypothetical protein
LWRDKGLAADRGFSTPGPPEDIWTNVNGMDRRWIAKGARRGLAFGAGLGYHRGITRAAGGQWYGTGNFYGRIFTARGASSRRSGVSIGLHVLGAVGGRGVSGIRSCAEAGAECRVGCLGRGVQGAGGVARDFLRDSGGGLPGRRLPAGSDREGPQPDRIHPDAGGLSEHRRLGGAGVAGPPEVRAIWRHLAGHRGPLRGRGECRRGGLGAGKLFRHAARQCAGGQRPVDAGL